MKRRLSRKYKIVGIFATVAVLVGVGFGTFLLTKPQPQQYTEPPKLAKAEYTESKPTEPEKAQHTVAPGLPRTLSIDTIGINNANILSVGLEADGALAAPASIYDVGWYKDSAKPGSGTGALLLDGHVSGVNDPNAIFHRLKELKKGATMTIEKGDGSKINYVVRETETLPIEKVDMRKMMRSIDPKREGLNIITCGGAYDYSRQLYEDRVMVYAVRQDS